MIGFQQVLVQVLNGTLARVLVAVRGVAVAADHLEVAVGERKREIKRCMK